MLNQIITLQREGKLRISIIDGPAQLKEQSIALYKEAGVGELLPKFEEKMMSTLTSFHGAAMMPIFTKEFLDANLHIQDPRELKVVGGCYAYAIIIDKQFLLSFTPRNRKALILHEIGHILDAERDFSSLVRTDMKSIMASEEQAWDYAFQLAPSIRDCEIVDIGLDSYRAMAGLQIKSSPESRERAKQKIHDFAVRWALDMFDVMETKEELDAHAEYVDYLIKSGI